MAKGKKENRVFSTKDKNINKHQRSKQAMVATAPDMTKGTGDPVADASRIYSNRGNKKNKYSCYVYTTTVDRVFNKVQSICDGSRLWEELL